jgi:ABC-2 type transport system permease protein
MLSLLRTEWLKISKYWAFWIMVGIITLSYPGINSIFLNIYRKMLTSQEGAGQVLKMFLGDPFSFPEVWRTTAFFSSLFVIIPAVLVIMLITNEFTYKTHRQNIIDGWSRSDFMLSKLMDVFIITILVTIVYALVAWVIGYTNSKDTSKAGELSYYIGLFALQTFSQLSLAFVFGLLLRKSFLALGGFLFYYMVLENIGVNWLKYDVKNDIGRFFPFEISDRIIPVPAFLGRFDEAGYKKILAAVNTHVVYTCLLIILTWAFCFWWYKRKDL